MNTEETQQIPVARIRAVDGIRGLAALIVCIHHISLNFHGIQGWNFLRQSGYIAVDAFIVISGFSLTLPLVLNNMRFSKGCITFLFRRARRLLPPYYAGLIISLILIRFWIGTGTGTHWDGALPVTWEAIRAHVFLVHDFSHSQRINHAYWVFALQAQLTLLFPLLILLWRFIGRIGLLVLTVGISQVLFWYGGPAFRSSYQAPAQFLILFVMGMLAADLVMKRDEGWRKSLLEFAPTCAVVFSLLTYVLYQLTLNSGMYQGQIRDVVFGILCVLIVLAVTCSHSNGFRQFFEHRFLVFLGAISYSLYLIHAPMIQVIQQYVFVPLKLSPVGMFYSHLLLGVPAIIFIAYIFYQLYELPFISHKAAVKRESPALDTSFGEAHQAALGF